MIGYLRGTVLGPETVLSGDVVYQVATATSLTEGEDVAHWVNTTVAETDICL